MPKARPRCAACGRFVSATVTVCRRCESTWQRKPLAVAMLLGLDEPALPPARTQALPMPPTVTPPPVDDVRVVTPIPIGQDVVRARARSDFIVPRPSELHPDLVPSTRGPERTEAERVGDVPQARRSIPAALVRSLVSVLHAMLEDLPHPRVAAAVVIVAVVVGIAVVVLSRG